MKLIYKGKFDGNPESLPCNEHYPGAVKFKEFDSPKKLGLFANIIAFILIAIFLGSFIRRSKFTGYDSYDIAVGAFLSLLILFPHEILHGLCFKEEVYLYTALKQGMLFVVGPEVMSKGRFIFMSMLPNMVFGFIPYIIAMIFPTLGILGAFGASSISMGAGDYINVFNAIRQMPKGAKTYLHQFNSYWYMPE